MKRAMLPVAALVALLAQVGSAAEGPDALTYSRGFLLTGNYVVSTIDLPRGGGTGTLTFSQAKGNAVPADAELAAAYLYWEALAPVGAPLAIARFRGVDISTAKAARMRVVPGAGRANCWGAAGGDSRLLTMFRADVLSMLPKQYDAADKWTGRYIVNDVQHSVELGSNGAGNNLMTVAGATLLLVYRDAAEPLRKIVIYDGVHSQGQGATTNQVIAGFYRSSPGSSARLTHIAGSGAKNTGERILFNGSPLPVFNPIPHPFDSGSDRGWASPTFDVSALMPGALSSDGFGEVVTTGIDHGASNQSATPYECLTLAAIVFSTTIDDSDGDGLPDALEEGGATLKDPPTVQFPLGAPLPDLHAMGARVGQKDLFVEINAMHASPGTTYGSPSAPYNSALVSVTDPDGHDHMPTPAVIKTVGDAYRDAGIHAHFDVGHIESYRALGADYACLGAAPGSDCDAAPYLVPSALARGGEQIVERASPTGQFPSFPGTIGWPLGVQVYRDAPVGDDGEELSNAEIRDGWLETSRRRRFDRSRQDYFHYALYAHARGRAKSELPCLDANGQPAEYEIDNTCSGAANPQFHVPSSVSGIADLPGGTALITLGLWDTDKFVGSPFVQASTTLHELGHNANLWHGGGPAVFGNKSQGTITAVEPNCKPNYLSIMSYMFQVHGLFDDLDRPHVDYSDRQHVPLSEQALIEAPLSPFPKYRVSWFAPVGSDLATFQNVPAAGRFCNGARFDPAAPPSPAYGRVRALGAQSSINWDGNPGTSAAVDIDFDGSTTQVFEGFDDWAHVRLDQIRAARFARIFTNSNGDLIDFGSGDLIDFGSGDLIDFGSGDLIDFGSGTFIVHFDSGDFLRYGSGDLIDFGSGDLIDFGSGVLMAAGADRGYNGGDLIDFGSGDLIDFGSGDLIDFGSGDLIDFGSGDLIDFASGDAIDFGPGDRLEFGGPGLQELDFEMAFGVAAPRPYGLAACIIGVDCVDPQPSDPNRRVRLDWSTPTFGSVSAYGIYRSTVGTPPVLIGSTTALSFIDAEDLPGGVFFTYWVNAQFDNGQSSNSDPVVIQTVSTAPPVAVNDDYRTFVNTVLNVPAPGVLSNDINPAGAAALVLATAGTFPTEFGMVTLNVDGSFSYTPNPGFGGIDSFTYRAGNGSRSANVPTGELSNEARVRITVRGSP